MIVTGSGQAPNGRHGFACFSPDRRLRWSLQRSWGHLPPWVGKPRRTMVWVLVNPSTAGATRDDPTVRRCLGYAEREGCTAVEVVNLTPQVVTRPVHLAETDEPDWAEVILDAVTAGAEGKHWGPLRDRDGIVPAEPLIMLGWGAAVDSRPWLAERAWRVPLMLQMRNLPWYALGFTKSGQPVHPLYQRADAPLLAGPVPEVAR